MRFDLRVTGSFMMQQHELTVGEQVAAGCLQGHVSHAQRPT